MRFELLATPIPAHGHYCLFPAKQLTDFSASPRLVGKPESWLPSTEVTANPVYQALDVYNCRNIALQAEVPGWAIMDQKSAREHLDKARNTVMEVERIVCSHTYPDDPRTVMVRGELSTIIQHHRSVLLLLKSGIAASSYSLTRDIIKSLRFGLWILSCATEEQMHRIEEDEEFQLTPEMIKDMESAYSTDPFFNTLKNRWDAQLSLYSRKRMVQLGRWHTGLSAGLDFDDEEVRHVTTTATLCVVLLAAMFLADQKDSADSKHIEALAADYPPQIS